jgi:hypothetical protein
MLFDIILDADSRTVKSTEQRKHTPLAQGYALDG